ncbi:MAG TPA: uracil-DNA glycosylase family protein, partial [Candidatus Saccharimonadales bacterium]|nr:uracil-DNA glycosylase family protein [Candidatus Saccharimonadales bacterium]
LPEEKAAFLPYLQGQLDVIKPKLIVTLGRHSMDVLLPGLKISQIHGQPKRIRVRSLGRVGGPGAGALQDASEKQTEAYNNTLKGVSQPATQQRAASKSEVSGSADEQTLATWVILPLFHPAAALYNGAMRQTLIDDFARIPDIIKLIET